MSEHIWDFGKIYHIGHPAIAELFDGEVYVEEKVDGSQFSARRIDGEVHFRSKGATVYATDPPKIFAPAVEYLDRNRAFLKDGWVYRFETLCKPKHNSLCYERVPQNNLMLLDIEVAPADFLRLEKKRDEAELLGVECVPLLMSCASKPSLDDFKSLLEFTSALGGQKIEGVVVKNYARFGRDGKALMGKYVSEEFREIHGKEWKMSNPNRTDMVQMLIEGLRTPARWNKAVQRLRDRGELQNAPQDIGPLIKEASLDVKEECEELIKEKLFAHFWPVIQRGVTRGLPNWYKELLLEAGLTDESS